MNIHAISANTYVSANLAIPVVATRILATSSSISAFLQTLCRHWTPHSMSARAGPQVAIPFILFNDESKQYEVSPGAVSVLEGLPDSVGASCWLCPCGKRRCRVIAPFLRPCLQ